MIRYNPYQRSMPPYGGGFGGGFDGGFGGAYLPRYPSPRMPSPYPMPSPFPGSGSFEPIRGGGMGQVIPTNIPFRDPGYGSPVRTQNLISAMSGPQDLMSNRTYGSLNTLDMVRNRPDMPLYSNALFQNPYRRNNGGGKGGRGGGFIRTSDFQDSNMNGVDDRDEGGAGIGGFFGGGYGRGMANPGFLGPRLTPPGAPEGGLGGPGEPDNPYGNDGTVQPRNYGVDRAGKPLTEAAYNWIINNGGEDTDGDGIINNAELEAYHAAQNPDAPPSGNYMPGTRPTPDPVEGGNPYGTRYDGKPFTEGNFATFDKAGGDLNDDGRMSENEWLSWMLNKGPSEGFEEQYATKLTGALKAGIEKDSLDPSTISKAVAAGAELPDMMEIANKRANQPSQTIGSTMLTPEAIAQIRANGGDPEAVAAALKNINMGSIFRQTELSGGGRVGRSSNMQGMNGRGRGLSSLVNSLNARNTNLVR